jgi:biopolymer transport protein ExbD
MISRPSAPDQPVSPASGAPGIPGAPSAHGPSLLPGDEHLKRKRRKAPDTRVSPLNIVPFLDMSFTLLLFLCLATSFSLGEGVLTANLPIGTKGEEGTGEEKLTELPLTIQLESAGDNAYRLSIQGFHESPADFAGLADQLKKLQTANGGPYADTTQVVIKPTADVRWDHVVNAFNAAVKARYKNIAFSQTE